MNRNRIGRVLAAVVALAVPGAAMAQERGRTDGPEGSEYGKGGYAEPGAGDFSLQLNFGYAHLAARPLSGLGETPPLFLGVTGSFWADEWFLLDVAGSHSLHSGRTNVFVGPRFRTGFYPVSLNLGVQAGPVFVPNEGVRFGLSPQVGVDSVVADHYVLGLQYAADIVFGSDLDHRIFMNVGYRF